MVIAERGEHVAVRVAAISLVRPHPGSGAGVASGDRPAALDLTFTEPLARVVDDQLSTSHSVTGEVLAGTLLAVGVDVVSIRLAPGADGIAYCPASALSSGALPLGVEVLERSPGCTCRLEERLDVLELEPQHPTELVRGDVALVDEAIQSAGRDAEMPSGILGS